MKIIGITGGIGSGKSAALAYLEREYHAYICEADQVAKKLQQKGTDCYEQIIAVFGEQILDGDGEIDRVKLAEIVFNNKNLLMQLNAIVHPAVKASIWKQIQCEREKNTELFVLEAALLLEDHYDEICDEIWFVYANSEARRRRLRTSRGYSDEKISAIFQSQLSRDEYLERCDRAIDNSNSFEETCLQLNDFMRKIRKEGQE